MTTITRRAHRTGAGRALAAAVLGLALAACASDELGPEFREISESESGLQFYGPGLGGGFRKFLTGTDDQHVRFTVGVYGPRYGEFPWANIRIVVLPTQRVFTRTRPLRETIGTREMFAGQSIALGDEGSTVNRLGRADYILFTADRQSCVAWQQVFGATFGGGLGRQSLDGLYCVGGNAPMKKHEAAGIVERVGHRDYGSIAPPPDWPAN